MWHSCSNMAANLEVLKIAQHSVHVCIELDPLKTHAWLQSHINFPNIWAKDMPHYIPPY